MKKRPILFTIVPLILIGVCASFYFQTAYVLNTDLTNYSRILSKITIYNWITMAAMIASGIAIMRSSKWAKLFMPLTIAFVFLNNYLVATYTNNFTKTQIFLAALLFALAFAPLYTKKIQLVLSDRKHQWWRTAFRKKYTVPVNVRPQSGNSFWSQSVDVSKTGLFLRLDSRDWSEYPKLGEKVNLDINLGKTTEVKCTAVVIRLVEARGFYPRGMGLQFLEFEDTSRKALDSFLKMSSPEV